MTSAGSPRRLPIRPDPFAVDSVRLDRFLWAARFYKTRALAQRMIEAGHVRVDGERAKPARAIRPGLEIRLRQGRTRRRIEVIALSGTRGGAPEARLLYRELDPPTEIGLFDED